ncbi:MAG: FAD binding domain-containing protein, partial [Hyphomicrobiaceae bacterium]
LFFACRLDKRKDALRRFLSTTRPSDKDIMGIYLRPTTLTHALECRAAGAEILAGGTDFWPLRVGNPTYITPSSVILDIGAVACLRGITRTVGQWRLGALVTWTEIADAPLPMALHALQMAAREVGGRQIQNCGTIAGNLCNASPAADSVPALLALGASVELASLEGIRSMPLAEFLVGPRRTALRPNEVMTAVLVPAPHPQARSHYIKLGARKYQLISVVMGAAVVRIDAGKVVEAALALGACSPVATRLPELEAAVIGAEVGELARLPTAAHLAGLAPIEDVRADAIYRREAALVVARRLLAEFTGEV